MEEGVRKCLVFDIDGVLLNFRGPLADWWNEKYAAGEKSGKEKPAAGI